MGELSAQRIEELQAYIRGEYPSARLLSRAIGVSEPDDNGSPGAVWLQGLRDSFCDNLGYILESVYPEDTAYEIAGNSAEEAYTDTMWRVFTDLELYRHVEDDTGETYRLDQMSSMAALALDAFGRELFGVLLNDVQGKLEELEEDDELDTGDEDTQEEARPVTPEEGRAALEIMFPGKAGDEEIPLMWD